MDHRFIFDKQFFVDSRGYIPKVCDFCKKIKNLDELEPDEADTWICLDCLKEEEEQIAQRLADTDESKEDE